MTEYKDYYGYKVSDDGHIIGKRGTELRPFVVGNKYLCVKIVEGYEYNTRVVHRIVAELFVYKPGPNFTKIVHINGNMFDNRACNLRWELDNREPPKSCKKVERSDGIEYRSISMCCKKNDMKRNILLMYIDTGKPDINGYKYRFI